MYHTIEFTKDLVFDLEISPRDWLAKVLICRGTRVQVQIKPYVVEGRGGPVEVADLFFANGTATRMVPFECFSFVE